MLGLAGTQHWRSIIFRREFPQLRDVIERSRAIYNSRDQTHLKDSYNEQLHLWRLGSGRIIELGAIQHEWDKENYRGRPHDLYGWDEIAQFSETQYRFVNTWNRTTRKGQRVRIVACGNPPSSNEGEWVLLHWGPWLNAQHPNPAKPGELRWFARIDDKDVEVESGKAFEHKGELIQPLSRTFIPARLHDNPYLAETNYGAQLQGLPEPLRSQLLYGDFNIRATDDAYQVIPTVWVQQAQKRWRESQKPRDEQGREIPLSVVGVDVARGGDDKTVLAKRFNNWFAPLDKHSGRTTPDGPSVAGLIALALTEGGRAHVDVIGIGSSAFDSARERGLEVFPINWAEGSKARDRSNTLSFVNKRAEQWWRMREALDPEKGEGLMLPDDPELLADLCAPRWKSQSNGILIESKEDMKKRIGRSPDCGDATVLALADSGWWMS